MLERERDTKETQSKMIGPQVQSDPEKGEKRMFKMASGFVERGEC